MTSSFIFYFVWHHISPNKLKLSQLGATDSPRTKTLAKLLVGLEYISFSWGWQIL